MRISLISESVLYARHSRLFLSGFSGRSVYRDAGIGFGYLSHSLHCLSSVSWHTYSIESLTRVCHDKTFVATKKMILQAAPANDTIQYPMCNTDIIKQSYLMEHRKSQLYLAGFSINL